MRECYVVYDHHHHHRLGAVGSLAEWLPNFERRSFCRLKGFSNLLDTHLDHSRLALPYV